MKYRAGILLLFYFLGTSFDPAFAQNLLLKNTKTGKVKEYKVNSRIQYRTWNDIDFMKGRISSISEFELMIEGEVVKIEDIGEIRKSSPILFFFRLVGIPVMLAGTTLAGTGAANAYANGLPNGLDYVGMGAGIFLAGLIPHLIKRKTYSLGNEWVFEVKKF
jgi:hypothetical protein